jgi:hypothetical protein
MAYRDGYTASSQLLVYGDDCDRKAKTCAAIVFDRLARAGYEYERTHVELLGAGEAAGIAADSAALAQQREIILRISVHDPRREAVDRFTKEIAPLVTSGPAGLAGYAAGRSSVRPVFAYWPSLIPKTLVTPQVEVRDAKAWAASVSKHA